MNRFKSASATLGVGEVLMAAGIRGGRDSARRCRRNLERRRADLLYLCANYQLCASADLHIPGALLLEQSRLLEQSVQPSIKTAALSQDIFQTQSSRRIPRLQGCFTVTASRQACMKQHSLKCMCSVPKFKQMMVLKICRNLYREATGHW